MNAYLKFVKLRKVMTFDMTAQALLDLICLRHAEGVPMKVTDAMKLKDLASPATLHRKLDDLFAFGYIEHKFLKDRRTKFLAPSDKAIAYVAQMNAAMYIATEE